MEKEMIIESIVNVDEISRMKVKAGARMTGDGNDLQIITFDIVEKP